MTIDNGNHRIELFGLPIDRISLDETVAKIDSFIKSREPHQIVLVNAAKVVKAKKDLLLREIIQTAALVAPDGVPLVWVSKLLGRSLPGRVNGTDLMEKLIPFAVQKQYSIYFLGSTEEIINKVVMQYKELFPTIRIAGFRNGYFSNEEEEEVVNRIRKSNADILFVGMGTPMKEKFVKRNLIKMNIPVVHGVGGSLDVVAGYVKRAPLWMQKWGLEWLYRFWREPGRMWKRYLATNSIFISMVAKEFFKYIFFGHVRNSVKTS